MATKTANDAMKTIETNMNTAKEQFETFAKTGAETFQKQYDDAVAKAQEQFEKVQAQAAEGYDQWVALSKANVDAFVKSGNVFAKGFEVFGKEVSTIVEDQITASTGAAKELSACKTLNEVVDLQTKLAKTNMDTVVSRSTKLQEMGTKMANDAYAPLKAQFEENVAKLSKPIAA